MKEKNLVEASKNKELSNAELAEILEALSVHYFRERATSLAYQLYDEARMYEKRSKSEFYSNNG
jgi:ribosomal protein L29